MAYTVRSFGEFQGKGSQDKNMPNANTQSFVFANKGIFVYELYSTINGGALRKRDAQHWSDGWNRKKVIEPGHEVEHGLGSHIHERQGKYSQFC
ncbi:hypothetical protein [Dubosiella newyorkensis]|uniref:hypothetical protein n=1 Tax=Dubosiella newyorkensis TaxID=1862672 RepID=UPI003F66DF2A